MSLQVEDRMVVDSQNTPPVEAALALASSHENSYGFSSNGVPTTLARAINLTMPPGDAPSSSSASFSMPDGL
jgi:hypothetical protein